jgi:hypothetical protein
MSQILIQKQVFDKDTFEKVVDTQFSQLINLQASDVAVPLTVDEFFKLYEEIFYQIPKEGDINSHRYILEKEAEYLGVNLNNDDVQALLDEITTLRQTVLDTQTALKG